MLAAFHLFGTTAFDVTLSTALLWLLLRAVRTGATRASGTSVDTALFLPLLLTLTGLLTKPFWATGAWALAHGPQHRGRRRVPLAAGPFLGAVLVTGGKPYYLLPVILVLVAAGTPAVLRWAGHRPWRTPALGYAATGNAIVGATLVLPLLPPRLAPVDVNYDLGEQVGWDELVAAVAVEHTEEPAGVVLTQNYGQAGALDRAHRAGADLPPVASGHNGYWWRSRPAAGSAPVLVVTRADADRLGRDLRGCERRASVTNSDGVDNDEDGVGLWRCAGPARPWSELWPDLQRLG